jgi:hypothetical protein
MPSDVSIFRWMAVLDSLLEGLSTMLLVKKDVSLKLIIANKHPEQYNLDIIIAIIMSMCPKNDELDVNRRNFGQVEPTPEPAPDIPEEPNGDEEEAGNEDHA